MNKKIISIVFTIFVLISNLFAQHQSNIEFKKSNFTDKDPQELTNALKELKQGNKFYNATIPDYSKALEHFLKAQEFNEHSAELNYKIGVCYVNSSNKHKAIPYLTHAVHINSRVAHDVYYQLGVAYHADCKFDLAIESFNLYKSSLSPSDLKIMNTPIERKIYECEGAKKFLVDTVRAFVDNIGAAINSPYSDYASHITTDQSMMIFTSKRENSYNKKKGPDNEYDENIYVSYKKSGQWEQAADIGSSLNSKDNNATVGISPDGHILFTYLGKKGGDIMFSERKGDKWTRPQPFKAINSPWHEQSASFSPDGRTVYFSSSNRDDAINFGQHDIFMCKMDNKGRWGKPINLGQTINTPYDEVDVFMHPDGRTLYFSSDGHKTIGGYDIYKSELKDDGSWTQPENLGYPINTPGDERFFVLAGNGRTGFYSSDRDGGFGGHDIYIITYIGPEKKLKMSTENNLIAAFSNPIQQDIVVEETVEIKTSRLTVVKGIVSDAEAKEKPIYLEAIIEITDNETGQLLSTLNSNAATGRFLVPLPSGKDYALTVKKEGYLFHSENFNIPPTKNYQEIFLDVKLMPIKKDAKIVLRNVFFEFNSSKLDPKSHKELDNLVQIMTDNPNMIIEIGGHTDNVGSHQYNQKLSESRAQSVVNYLAKSIPMSRLNYKGYAFDLPVATNTTDEGRALNRRVEFKIISND